MRYRVLGGTDIEVSVHCLGTMMFGAVGNPDHDECVRIVHAALDRGVNVVDTADMYSAGESEVIVGKALKGGAGTTWSSPRRCTSRAAWSRRCSRSPSATA